MEHVQKNGLVFRGNWFVPTDVEADGNCLFHSIAKDPLAKMENGFVCRQRLIYEAKMLWEKCEEKQGIKKLFTLNSTKSFGIYLEKMSKNGIWGTTFEMTLFYLIYGVNLISISNFTSKSSVFDAKLTCNLMQVDCPQE